MNRYGTKAMEHWKRWRPRELQQIPDPEAFFTRLGEEIAQMVEELEMAIAGDDPPGEGYLEKVGRLGMARLNAEEEAFREFLLEPESDMSGEEAP